MHGRDPRTLGPQISVPLAPQYLTHPPKDPHIPAGRWQGHLAVKFLAKFFIKGTLTETWEVEGGE